MKGGDAGRGGPLDEDTEATGRAVGGRDPLAACPKPTTRRIMGDDGENREHTLGLGDGADDLLAGGAGAFALGTPGALGAAPGGADDRPLDDGAEVWAMRYFQGIAAGGELAEVFVVDRGECERRAVKMLMRHGRRVAWRWGCAGWETLDTARSLLTELLAGNREEGTGNKEEATGKYGETWEETVERLYRHFAKMIVERLPYGTSWEVSERAWLDWVASNAEFGMGNAESKAEPERRARRIDQGAGQTRLF